MKFPFGRDPEGQGFFWPDSAQKRSEWLATKRNSPIIAESVYQCNPGARQGVIFIAEDFTYYDPPEGLEHGIASPAVKEFVSRGEMVVQGWDTAFSANSRSDYTVCVTAVLVPSSVYYRGENPALVGECDSHYRVYLLDVWREKIDFADLVPAARAQLIKWAPQFSCIENRAYGTPLIESLQKAGVPVEKVEPVDGKRSRAIEGIGAGSVQGWFRQHRVVSPAGAEWLEGYERELKDFTGERGGRDDRVDATVHLVQYAIRQGAGIGMLPSDWSDPASVDRQMGLPQAGTAATSPLLGGFTMSDVVDPFDGFCVRCVKYSRNIQDRRLPRDFCTRLKMPMPAIGGCDDFENAANPAASFPRS